MIHEELKLMNRQLEHKAEKDRLIDSMRFTPKRDNSYLIKHRCILCKQVMIVNPYSKHERYNTMHHTCGKILRRFKKPNNRRSLKWVANTFGVIIQ